MNAPRTTTDSLLTALAPSVWGSTYLVTTQLLPADRPLLAAAVRALPAGLILLAVFRVLPRGAWWWKAAVLGTLNIGAFFYFLFVAAYHLPGGVAALVMSVQPVIVLLLAALLLGDRIRTIHVLACTVGAVGVGMLVLGPDAGADLVGVLAGLAGAASMATGIVLTKRWGRPEGVGTLTFTGWQLAAGGVVLTPLALSVEGLPAAVTTTNLLGFAYLSIIGALLAYALWFRGIARLSALAVSFLGFASPLTATVLGYLVLREGLSPLQVLGALAVIGSVVLAQIRTATPATPRTPLPTARTRARPSASSHP